MSSTLFPELERPRPPLAERIRPRRLDEVLGHAEVLAPEGWLRRALASGNLPHLILWGPPGVGKTTLAALLAREVDAEIEIRSAVQIGVADLRKLLDEALARWRRRSRRTLLFLDEIHRFNKAQQDALLHDVERGTVTLIGATTENPAFSLNPALRSRSRIVVLEALGEDDVRRIIERAVGHPEGLAVPVEAAAVDRVVAAAEGDARVALSLLEAAAAGATEDGITADLLDRILAADPLRHDRDGDRHYDVVSAWIKSMRGGDPDAAIYWGARLWEAGEDRRFLFRRLIIFASEDVGNADLRALGLATAAAGGYERVGDAEGWILFAQVVTALAAMPKSKAAYRAFRAARELLAKGSLPVPAWLRNAPTELARELGHGAGYVDAHGQPGAQYPEGRYLPDALPEPMLYVPTSHGDEAMLAGRLAAFRARRRRAREGTLPESAGPDSPGADPASVPE